MCPTGRSTRAASEPRRRDAPRLTSFPIDIVDRGDEYLVSTDLPGYRKRQFDLTVRGDRLRIAATDDEEEPGTGRRRRRGTVRRVVRLPEAIDEKRVSASYNAGILRVTLRKLPRSRRVEIE